MITVNPTILRHVAIGIALLVLAFTILRHVAIGIALLVLALLLWSCISSIRRRQHNNLEERFISSTQKDKTPTEKSLDTKPSSLVTANPLPKDPDNAANCFKVHNFTGNIFNDHPLSTQDMLIVNVLDPDDPFNGTTQRLSRTYCEEEATIKKALKEGWGISGNTFDVAADNSLKVKGIEKCKARVLYVNGISKKEMQSASLDVASALVASVYHNMCGAIQAVQLRHNSAMCCANKNYGPTRTVCYIPTMEYGDSSVHQIGRYQLFVGAFLSALGLPYDVSNERNVKAVANELMIDSIFLEHPEGLQMELFEMLADQSIHENDQSAQSSDVSQAVASNGASSSGSLYPSLPLAVPSAPVEPQSAPVGHNTGMSLGQRLFHGQQTMGAFPQQPVNRMVHGPQVQHLQYLQYLPNLSYPRNLNPLALQSGGSMQQHQPGAPLQHGNLPAQGNGVDVLQCVIPIIDPHNFT